MKRVITSLLCGTAACALASVESAQARQIQSSAAPAAEVQLEEVIVTAQKRSESAQKTALAITAMSGKQLEQQGVRTVTDLTTLVPGVQIGSTNGSVELSVRGIGSTNNSEVGDPAVAFNVDGVYMARPRSAAGLFFDLDRTEVLRGPQGTLYGRNATAGSLNVITRKPTSAFEASAQLEAGNFDLLRTSGVLNVPVSEKARVRAAFQTEKHENYTYGLNNRFNDENAIAGRVHILLTPSDTLSFLVTGDYFRNKGVGQANAPLGQYDEGGDAYQFPLSRTGSSRQENYGAAVQLDWRLPFGVLTYLGSARKDNSDWIMGSGREYPTGTVQPAGRCEPLTGVGCATLLYRSREKQQSHELRLGGEAGKLKWVTGLYVFDEDNAVLLNIFSSVAFLQPSTTAKSKAAFAQATYSVSDRLRLTTGLRYTHDKKARIGGTYVGLDNSAACTLPGGLNGSLFASVPGCLLYANVADVSWNSTNYKVGLEYDLTSTSLLYVSTATGYKAGGFGDGEPPNNNTYDPERLTAYEAGIKNRFLDNRIQANMSTFFYNYRDFQVSARGVVAGQGSNITVNADKATLYGAEFEGSILVTEQDRLDAAISYLHTNYDRFVLPSGDTFNPGVANYSGLTLAKSPKWTLGAGYQHTWTLPNDGRVTARIQSHFESAKNLDYHGFAVTRQDAYSKTDVMVTYDDPERRWSLMVYGRNLENEAVLVQASPDGQYANAAAGSGAYAPPRLYGVQLSARF